MKMGLARGRDAENKLACALEFPVLDGRGLSSIADIQHILLLNINFLIVFPQATAHTVTNNWRTFINFKGMFEGYA